MAVRPQAVAGSFYPADSSRLERDVLGYLEASPGSCDSPKVVIAPHAGYLYSGEIAGSAFATLSSLGRSIRRVVVVGPSHFVSFDGIALSGAEAFETPLGRLCIDVEAERRLEELASVSVMPEAHYREHALEVELPFLQIALGSPSLVALVVGRASAAQVAEALDLVWGGEETLVVVSSDLSHFLDYVSARRVDSETARIIEQGRPEVESGQACGFRAINGLLQLLALGGRDRDLAIHRLDLRNSGDTAGPRDRVVGYGAFAFC